MLQAFYLSYLSFTYRLDIDYTQTGLDSFIDSLTTTATKFIQYAKESATNCLNSVPQELKSEVEREHSFIYYCFRKLIMLECKKREDFKRAVELGKAFDKTRITSA